MFKSQRSPLIKASMAAGVLVALIGLVAVDQTQAQAPTTATPAIADLDMIHVQGSGAACMEPTPARLLIGWLNDVPPHGWPEDVFPPNVETVTIDSATVTTADGVTTLSFSPTSILDPSDPRAQIESSEFFIAGLPVTQPTYEVVYTVTYTDDTTETFTYARDIGIALPAVGCPVPGPPTTNVSPTTAPSGSDSTPATGATPIPSSPSYAG